MEAIKKVHASVSQTYTKTSFSSSCCCCYYFMCTTGSAHTKDDMDPKNTHTHTFRTNNRKTYKTLCEKKGKKIWCGVPSSSSMLYKYNNNNNKKGEEKIYNPIYKRKVNQLYLLLCGFFLFGIVDPCIHTVCIKDGGYGTLTHTKMCALNEIKGRGPTVLVNQTQFKRNIFSQSL